jgi:hypothetical protein
VSIPRAVWRSCVGHSIPVAYGLGASIGDEPDETRKCHDRHPEQLRDGRSGPGGIRVSVVAGGLRCGLRPLDERRHPRVRHEHKLDPTKRVIVRFEYKAPEFTVSVEDEGEGFNPDKVPDPLAEENLLRASGRGIFFMKNFMDEVSYRFEPNRGTRVTMMKRVNGAPSN